MRLAELRNIAKAKAAHPKATDTALAFASTFTATRVNAMLDVIQAARSLRDSLPGALVGYRTFDQELAKLEKLPWEEPRDSHRPSRRVR